MTGESRVRQRLLRGALFHCQTAFPSYDAEGIFMATGKSQKQASGGSALGFEARAGNHLSFNPLHAQSRNYLGKPENYDFDFFFTSFGPYVRPSRSRRGIDLVNQMERRLNFLAQEAFGEIMNPLKLSRYVSRAEKDRRSRLATPERMARLKELVKTVRRSIREDT